MAPEIGVPSVDVYIKLYKKILWPGRGSNPRQHLQPQAWLDRATPRQPGQLHPSPPPLAHWVWPPWCGQGINPTIGINFDLLEISKVYKDLVRMTIVINLEEKLRMDRDTKNTHA